MIASVLEYGSTLSLRESNGNQISIVGISSDSYLLGHSSTFLVVQNGNMIMTIDENSRTLGNVIHHGDYRVGGINENGFYVKTGSLTTQYDKYCNIVSKY